MRTVVGADRQDSSSSRTHAVAMDAILAVQSRFGACDAPGLCSLILRRSWVGVVPIGSVDQSTGTVDGGHLSTGGDPVSLDEYRLSRHPSARRPPA
jgi:hypothetical protein